MKIKGLLALCNLVISILIYSGCHEKKDMTEVVKELNNQIIELPHKSPLTYSDQFIGNLHNWQDYEIVGLGEATHGTKEFFELKHRLFKYLAEQCDFKILAYEFSFRTSLRINDFVLNGNGTLDSLFIYESWIQDNYEVKDLIQWMRNYNKDKKEEQKVKFIGMDNQLDAFYPEKTIDCIKKYYPEILLLNNSLIEQILELKHIKYENITTEEYERRRDLFLKLKEVAQDYFEGRDINTIDYKITMHLIESLINSNQWLYNIYSGKKNNRDIDLANNVQWIKDTYNTKVTVWAHNAHVQNNPDYYPDGGASMGTYLKDYYGWDYLMVCTAFTKGKFIAVMEGPNGDTPPMICELYQNPPKGSVNELFDLADYKNFYLDVNSFNEKSKLNTHLDTLRPMLGVGDCYAGGPEPHYTDERITNLTSSTDVIFYFTDTKPVDLKER